MDESCIAGVHRGTVVRGEGELPTGEVRITDCHDSVVYVLAPLQSALLSGCSDCTIVLGAVGAMLRMERCDRVQVRGQVCTCVVLLAWVQRDCAGYPAVIQYTMWISVRNLGADVLR